MVEVIIMMILFQHNSCCDHYASGIYLAFGPVCVCVSVWRITANDMTFDLNIWHAGSRCRCICQVQRSWSLVKLKS